VLKKLCQVGTNYEAVSILGNGSGYAKSWMLKVHFWHWRGFEAGAHQNSLKAMALGNIMEQET
jgi:hypothetical protein